MKSKHLLIVAALAVALQFTASAQTNASGTNAVALVAHVNKALIPVKHQGARTDVVVQRAKAAPGDYALNSSATPSRKAGRRVAPMSGTNFTAAARSSTSALAATAPNTSSGALNKASLMASKPKSPSS